MEWNDDQDRHLRQWRCEGLSFGLIVSKFKALGKPRSKNSIIGRAARLALPALVRPAHELPRHHPKHVAPRVVKRTLAPREAAVALLQRRHSGPAAAHHPHHSITNGDAVAGAFLGLSLIDLDQTTCRYPDGDNPILFCGQPPVKGSPYCSEHHQICFIRSRL